MRLMGLTSRNTSVMQLSRDVIPWTWVAFAISVLTGTLMGGRDSSLSVLGWIHDQQRGYPLTFRTPRVPNDGAPAALATALDEPLGKTLERIRWEPKPKP